MQAKSAIIIGGGIAGCSTAYALAKRGFNVTLLEQHSTIAAEASGNPIATLYPKLSIKPSAQSALALLGFAFTLNLLKKLPNHSSFFTACGQIQLAYDAREQIRQEALFTQYHDDFFHTLNANAASEIAGIRLNKGGLFLPQAGWVKPKQWCHALLNTSNVTTITHARVTHIEKNHAQWQIHYIDSSQENHAQQLDLKADILVLCNANQVQQFNFCASALTTPVRGQVNFFAATAASQRIKTIICATHYLSPAADGLHAIGATYAPNDANPQLSQADSLENLTALKCISPEIFNSIQPYSARGRVAWRSHTQDYLPLAGQLMDEKVLREKPPRYNAKPADLPWLEGLYVNAGHGSKGMITAPICAEMIANLITNQGLSIDAPLLSKLNPSRFLLKELGLKQLASALYGLR